MKRVIRLRLGGRLELFKRTVHRIDNMLGFLRSGHILYRDFNAQLHLYLPVHFTNSHASHMNYFVRAYSVSAVKYSVVKLVTCIALRMLRTGRLSLTMELEARKVFFF